MNKFTSMQLEFNLRLNLTLFKKINLVVFFFTALALGMSQPIWALEVDFFDRQVTGRIDTRVSLGFSVRTEDADPNLVGIANGGKALGVNNDDGNLNFADKGDIFSAAGKVLHEVDLNYRNFGLFSRFYYFYDVGPTNPDRTALSGIAKERSVGRFQLLDLYGTGDFEVASSQLNVRLGNQIINWGESTFIPNGINGPVSFDISQLRVAGAEIREAFLPTPAVDFNINLTDRFSAEGYYKWGWQETFLEPRGTFFSTNDFASPGGTFALVTGAGTLPDNPPTAGTFVSRVADLEARDSGQFGLAVRFFVPEWNDTEFGLYFQHFHSHLPIISATRVTTTGVASTGNYFLEFPEDISLLGASFNTEIFSTGWALQGEVSYRINQPLQVDDQELLVAALNLCGVGGRASQLDKTPGTVFCGFAAGDKIEGFRLKDVIQLQSTVTKVWGATFGADQMVLVAEAGITIIPKLEDKSVLRYEGPGTVGSGHPGTAAAGGVPTQLEGFADDLSWGYRVLFNQLYTNAIGPINLTPQIAWAHDVAGTTPLPIANFVENRKTITLSVKGTYLNSWEGKVSYTNFMGAGTFNVRRDRDFVSSVVSYAF